LGGSLEGGLCELAEVWASCACNRFTSARNRAISWHKAAVSTACAAQLGQGLIPRRACMVLSWLSLLYLSERKGQRQAPYGLTTAHCLPDNRPMPEDSASTSPAETRRLAAIMFTDIVGFSRQMGADETRMLRLLELHNQIIQQTVADHHGHVIKSTGDGFLMEFPSVVNAVRCAQQIHSRFRAYNADKEPAAQLHLRIGIHLGECGAGQPTAPRAGKAAREQYGP
jgi:hypothetical protein